MLDKSMVYITIHFVGRLDTEQLDTFVAIPTVAFASKLQSLSLHQV